MEPPPDVEQDRRPAVRTNTPPHLPSSYKGSPAHHDLKTLGSSDYAYTYSGMGIWYKCGDKKRTRGLVLLPKSLYLLVRVHGASTYSVRSSV
jgi:hypothetical protein